MVKGSIEAFIEFNHIFGAVTQSLVQIRLKLFRRGGSPGMVIYNSESKTGGKGLPVKIVPMVEKRPIIRRTAKIWNL